MKFKDLKKQLQNKDYINHPNDFKEEGEDHVNIGMKSSFKLGKVLDPAYIKIIDYPHIGKFSSVLNLWYWLRDKTHNDSLRRLNSRDLKKYAVNNPEIYNNFIPNFKAIIGYSTWIKLSSYPELVKELKELNEDIVFLSYYVVESSKLRVSTNYSKLITDIVDIIRTNLIEDKEPNFDSLSDGKTDITSYYLANLKILK